MQLCPLHRRSVSSSIRAARLGNFTAKVVVVRFNEIALDSPCARVYRQGRYSRVVDSWIHVADAAIGLRRLKKQRNVDKKKTVLVL